MWWEIAPGALIIMTCISVPYYIRPHLANLFNGKPYSRSMYNARYTEYTMRDERLSGGNAFKTMGLDNIPDEPQHQASH